MSQRNNGDSASADNEQRDDLERMLIEGVSLTRPITSSKPPRALSENDDAVEDEESGFVPGGDLQGAIGLFAEAAQDMATAGVELGLGRHFACVDFCNQAAEKAAQAVSLRRFGRRSMYDHDLGKLGAAVGASAEMQEAMAALSPFHPEAFYMDTPPEEADAIIDAEQAAAYMQSARRVLRWSRDIVLGP
ncbi:MAG: HEPN domain-containing protein [Ktedonobacteraceae bacterium]